MRYFLLSAFWVAAISPLSAMAEVPLRVEYVPVEISPQTYSISLTGTIEAKTSVDLSFRSGGRVIEVRAEVGDRVKRGDLLARIDPLQQYQSMLAADAAVVSAQAIVAQAEQAAQRQAAMLERGVGTRAARDSAAEALSQAQGRLQQALTDQAQGRRSVDDTVLRASVDGVITARNAEPGQIVGAAQPVLSLAAMDGFEAVFQTPDDPHTEKAMGAPVSLELIDAPGPGMSGTVTEIAPLVDPNTASVAVRAEIRDAPPDASLLGAAVRGTVQLPSTPSIRLPWTVLSEDGTDPAVWVVDPKTQTVTMAKISIARFTTDSVLVSDGLSPGQIVVGAGSQMLYPGRLVEAARPNEVGSSGAGADDAGASDTGVSGAASGDKGAGSADAANPGAPK
ncbi:efflux RND transporter periplasmic adaptor subunit [Paracoccus pacificus]|uniref:Efflux RND transporter periplasmic adaptor subunit n=1 Tax=Paracoccus pacificus TaxID=1463598 RepID=A0ABW4RDB8_9RHOB